MKNMNSFGYGDHYVNLKISVPRKLNEKQRALLQAYAEIEEDTPGIIRGITYKKDGECIASYQFWLLLVLFFYLILFYASFLLYFVSIGSMLVRDELEKI